MNCFNKQVIYLHFSKQITELIEENALRKRQKRSNVLAARNRQNVIFKDISRLVFGVADIFRCQVDLLLGKY